MKRIYVFLLIFLLTGCWNYQELNDYAIVTGMAIDINNNDYEVSLLIANGTKSDNGTSETQVTVLSGNGKNIYEAIKDISLSTPKELYISHLSVVVISEEIAKQGVTPVLDFLLREPQSHQNFYLIIAKNAKAKDQLSILTPLADYPSQNITYNIKMTEKLQGRITDASFNSFTSKLLEKGINPIANSLVLIDDLNKGINEEEQEEAVTKAYTKLDTLGIFKGDKLVSWTTIEESIGINMLIGDIDTFYITIPCENDNMVITSNDFKIQNTVTKNKVTINIKAEGSINEVGCQVDLEDANVIKKYQKVAENKMTSYVNQAINKAKKLESDIFGYGNMIYQKYPKYFNSIKEWDKEFPYLETDVNISLNLKNKGALEQTIGELAK